MAIVALSCAAMCASVSPNPGERDVSSPQIPSLRDKYRGFFPIGAAISPWSLRSGDRLLIDTHVNLITPENEMKPELIHPAENRYAWQAADVLLEYAESNDMTFHGHCLVWHLQMPDWMRWDNGELVSRDVLIERMRDHIHTVIGRYRGRIRYWDVVNEALSDDPSEFYRTNSLWYRVIGEEFIELAFRYAHEADPDAILLYNDYALVVPHKRQRALELARSLLEKGVPIHGIGEQGHWNLTWPAIDQIKSTIDAFDELGLEFHVTELDIDIYPGPSAPEMELPSEEIEDRLSKRYGEIFSLFRRESQKIDSVTFWGISDAYTWLDNFPVANRKNAPLLFDTNRDPKRAFWEVVSF